MKTDSPDARFRILVLVSLVLLASTLAGALVKAGISPQVLA